VSSNNFIHFVKTDRELNPLTEKFYKGDAYYVTYYFTRTNDGGFLFLSTCYDYSTQNNERDIYILKTDAEGNLPTSIKDLTIVASELFVYPNPGNDILQFRTAVQQFGGIFYLYDISGKQILAEQVNSSFTQINTSNLPSGTYIFKYINKNTVIETGKWIKK